MVAGLAGPWQARRESDLRQRRGRDRCRAEGAAPEVIQTWEQARHAQSSRRICVEHAIAGSKTWRPLQRWIGRREYLPETITAVGSLVSDRAAAW